MEYDLLKAIDERHSVRCYSDKKIRGEVLDALNQAIDEINSESGLTISLVTDDHPTMKTSTIIGCNNYFVMAGPKGRDIDIGYYGEKLVLIAQALGLNTVWVAISYVGSKCQVRLCDVERRYLLIGVGYGSTQGKQHKSKPLSRLAYVQGEMPDWFEKGMNAAMAAPTALNQQQFRIHLEDGQAKGKILFGPCAKIDYGIVKYHFELASGHKLELKN